MKGLSYITKIIGILIMLITDNSVYGQDFDELLKQSKENFATEHGDLYWIKDMSGFLDGYHKVRMILVTDNKDFHGFYRIESSGETFSVEGEFSGEEIVLHEYDKHGRLSGIIKGNMNDSEFYTEWSDYKNVERLPLNLFTHSPYEHPCGNVGWLWYATGNEEIRDIYFFKVGLDKKIAFFLNDTYRSFKLECIDESCSEMTSIQEGESEEQRVEVIFNNDILSMKILLDEKFRSITLSPNKTMDLDCISYADYCQRSSIIVPTGKSSKFKKWLNGIVQPVEKKCGKDLVLVDNNGTSVLDRYTNTTIGNMKIDLFNDSIFSGLFVFQSSLDMAPVETSFIYDFQKSKPIGIDDIFMSKDMVLARINAAVKSYQDSTYLEEDMQYFKNTPFDIITLGQNGFICRCPLSTIYGSKSITVPYEIVMDCPKKKKSVNLNPMKWIRQN